ncbi:transposable element Tcb1 transposase [Trichonephila clavipes]|nr:transposable element Tcb1 transposase [Trichonephila clavipes]
MDLSLPSSNITSQSGTPQETNCERLQAHATDIKRLVIIIENFKFTIDALRLNGITDESHPTLTNSFQSLVHFGGLHQLARKDSGLPRDCGLSFREIGNRVGRNQATVMQICDRWIQEGTMDRRGQSHPPQCTTSREDRQIVCMAVTDRSVSSRTIAQHIESLMHHSVSARTIRRRLQQSGLSARRPLLGLPLTQNHRRLCRQWSDERRMWVAEWNEVVFTDKDTPATPRWSDSSLETLWREDAEQAPPHWYCNGYYGMGWYWISLSHSSSTHCRYFKQPVLHLRGVGARCPSLPSGLCHSHISTG